MIFTISGNIESKTLPGFIIYFLILNNPLIIICFCICFCAFLSPLNLMTYIHDQNSSPFPSLAKITLVTFEIFLPEVRPLPSEIHRPMHISKQD